MELQDHERILDEACEFNRYAGYLIGGVGGVLCGALITMVFAIARFRGWCG